VKKEKYRGVGGEKKERKGKKRKKEQNRGGKEKGKRKRGRDGCMGVEERGYGGG